MGNLTGAARFFLFLACAGLLLVVLGKGMRSPNFAATLAGTGEVLFFVGVLLLLFLKKG